MAAMATPLVRFSGNGNTVTYTTAGDSVSAKKQFRFRRVVPEGNKIVAQSNVDVIHTATDGTDILGANLLLSASSRVPVGTADAEIDAAIVIIRDYVASDEYVAAVKSLALPS